MEIGNLFNANGRIGRKDWIIWIIAVWVVFSIIAAVLGVYDERNEGWFALLSIIPAIAGIFLGIKRLHDMNKSGWLYILNFIPIVAFFFSIYLIVWKGDAGDNQYGAPNSGTPFPSLH